MLLLADDWSNQDRLVYRKQSDRRPAIPDRRNQSIPSVSLHNMHDSGKATAPPSPCFSGFLPPDFLLRSRMYTGQKPEIARILQIFFHQRTDFRRKRPAGCSPLCLQGSSGNSLHSGNRIKLLPVRRPADCAEHSASGIYSRR